MGESNLDTVNKVCIVLPTYNEAGNIRAHLDRVFAEQKKQKKRGIALHVLVVDDNSPDGTADIVRSYKNPHVHLLLRTTKEGLGKAYIAGIKHAIKTLDPDVVYEMDADGQHEATDIYRLLDALQGADMVIGSRYVAGGNVSKDWGLHRKLTSTCARVITRAMLRLGDIQDCSGGFRAIRTDILREIDLDSLKVRGYAFQAVLLEEILHHGGIVREVPIKFNGRGEGVSKMRLNDMIEGGTICIRIRAKRMLSKKKRPVRRPFLPSVE